MPLAIVRLTRRGLSADILTTRPPIDHHAAFIFQSSHVEILSFRDPFHDAVTLLFDESQGVYGRLACVLMSSEGHDIREAMLVATKSEAWLICF